MQRYEWNSTHNSTSTSNIHRLRHKGVNAVRAPQIPTLRDVNSWIPLPRPLLDSTLTSEDVLEASIHPNTQAIEMLDATIKFLKENHMDTQALSCSEQLLSLKREMYGFTHPTVLQTLEEVVQAYNSVAIELLSANKHTDCLSTLHKAETLIKPDKFSGCEAGRILTYNNIACCLRRMGKLKSALRYLKEALQIGLNCEHVKNISVTYMNLCAVSSQLGQHDAALEYAQAAVFYVQDELVGIGSVDNYERSNISEKGAKEQKLLALAIAYHNFAVELEFNNKGEASLQWYKKSFQIGTRCKEINPALHQSFLSAFENAKKRYKRVEKPSRTVHRPALRERPQSANINGSKPRGEYDENNTLHKAYMSKPVDSGNRKMQVKNETSPTIRSHKIRPRTARPPNDSYRPQNRTRTSNLSEKLSHSSRNGISVLRPQSSASRNGQQKSLYETKADECSTPQACLLFDFHDTESLLPSRPKPMLSSESAGLSPKLVGRHLQALQDCRSLNKQWSNEALDLIKDLDEDKATIPTFSLVQNEVQSSTYEHGKFDKRDKDSLPEHRSTHLDYLRKMREIAQSIRNDLTGDFATSKQDGAAKAPVIDKLYGKAPVQISPTEPGQRPPLNPRHRYKSSKIEERRQKRDSAAALIQTRIQNYISGRQANLFRIEAERKARAATDIQKMYRGHIARDFVAEQKIYNQSAVKLQALYRGFQTRHHVYRELAVSLSRSYIEEQHYRLELASAVGC
ncbi:hypothetical protein ABG067_003851 [Albugo candida]